jgi:hypothetical protein
MTDQTYAAVTAQRSISSSTNQPNGRKTQSSHFAEDLSADGMEYTPSLQSQCSFDPNAA